MYVAATSPNYIYSVYLFRYLHDRNVRAGQQIPHPPASFLHASNKSIKSDQIYKSIHILSARRSSNAEFLLFFLIANAEFVREEEEEQENFVINGMQIEMLFEDETLL